MLEGNNKNNMLQDFDVPFGNNHYFLEFKPQDVRSCKEPVPLTITRHHRYTTFWGEVKEEATLLERKNTYHFRRRIYHNLDCIQKLKDGRIRKYQVHNELELRVLEKYLHDHEILFQIVEQCPSYTRKYGLTDHSYKFCFRGPYAEYQEENTVTRGTQLYVQVYKGYVNCSEPQHQYNKKKPFRYGIYLR